MTRSDAQFLAQQNFGPRAFAREQAGRFQVGRCVDLDEQILGSGLSFDDALEDAKFRGYERETGVYGAWVVQGGDLHLRWHCRRCRLKVSRLVAPRTPAVENWLARAEAAEQTFRNRLIKEDAPNCTHLDAIRWRRAGLLLWLESRR